MPAGTLQRILDRRDGAEAENEAIDRQMCTNYPMEISRYRLMRARQYERGQTSDSAGYSEAMAATATELAPYRGKGWEATKAAAWPAWWAR
jgi:hypothetical protein